MVKRARRAPHVPTRWERELNKFQGVRVTVAYSLGGEIIEVEGILVAWLHNSLNCILDMDGKSVVIRFPLLVTRKRHKRGLSSTGSPAEVTDSGEADKELPLS